MSTESPFFIIPIIVAIVVWIVGQYLLQVKHMLEIVNKYITEIYTPKVQTAYRISDVYSKPPDDHPRSQEMIDFYLYLLCRFLYYKKKHYRYTGDFYFLRHEKSEIILGKLSNYIRDLVLEYFSRQDLSVLEALGSCKTFLEFEGAINNLEEVPPNRKIKIELWDTGHRGFDEKQLKDKINYSITGSEIRKQFKQLIEKDRRIVREYCDWYAKLLEYEIRCIYSYWYNPFGIKGWKDRTKLENYYCRIGYVLNERERDENENELSDCKRKYERISGENDACKEVLEELKDAKNKGKNAIVYLDRILKDFENIEPITKEFLACYFDTEELKKLEGKIKKNPIAGGEVWIKNLYDYVNKELKNRGLKDDWILIDKETNEQTINFLLSEGIVTKSKKIYMYEYTVSIIGIDVYIERFENKIERNEERITNLMKDIDNCYERRGELNIEKKSLDVDKYNHEKNKQLFKLLWPVWVIIGNLVGMGITVYFLGKLIMNYRVDLCDFSIGLILLIAFVLFCFMLYQGIRETGRRYYE